MNNVMHKRTKVGQKGEGLNELAVYKVALLFDITLFFQAGLVSIIL